MIDNVTVVYTQDAAVIVQGFGLGLFIMLMGYFLARTLALIKRVIM